MRRSSAGRRSCPAEVAAATSAWLRACDADLGVDAVAQVERERHLERDDRQQQDVGERQEQAAAEAHSSGPRKRKPTPRTVWR